MTLGEVTVGTRFNGPPDSGNGGYVAGRLAAFVDAPGVTVRLNAPPPLDRPMRVVANGDGAVELRDGDVVVAVARPGEVALEVPARVDPAAAAVAARDAPWADVAVHPFPTCFGCGPLREAGDALRHLPGDAGEGLVACPACTDARLPHDGAGRLLPEVVWAALDCPSAVAGVPVGAPAHVLATLTVRVERPVLVGEPHVVVAWPLGADGRKKRAASALLDATGRTCAIGEALWIELRR